jgi:RHS repeat-associated protein
MPALEQLSAQTALGRVVMRVALKTFTMCAVLLTAHFFIPPRPAIAAAPAGVVSIRAKAVGANANTASTGTIAVLPDQTTLIYSYSEYNIYTCAEISPGSWTVNTQPSKGTVSTANITGVAAPNGCPQASYTFAAIYYTPNPGVAETTDSFTATWSTPDGQFNITNTYTLTITAPVVAKNNGKCACGVGDPIEVSTGNVFEQATDYATAGPNQLAFIRSYNSMTGSDIKAVDLGGNWRSNYDRYLTIAGSTATAERPDGRVVSFVQTGGQWLADSDVDITLENSGSAWVLTDHDDTVETYGSSSVGSLQLTSITARGGYTQTLSYNSNAQISAVTDSYGRTLSFYYTGAQLTSLATADGTTITYGYNTTQDHLTSVTYPGSATVTYVYENSEYPFELTGIIDELGNRFATWTYDDFNRATSSQHAGGADLTTVVYNGSANGVSTVAVTNALGEQQLYTFAILQNAPKLTQIQRLSNSTTAAATRSFNYDTNGYLTSATDWNGYLTKYVNDARGLPVTVTEAVGTPAARTTRTTWATDFHVPTSISTQGLSQHFGYDTVGNLVNRTDVGTNAPKRSWIYVWNDAHLVSIIGPRTDLVQKTTFTYGAYGRLTGITNALGQKTTIPNGTDGGLPLTVVDPNGVTTKLTYDARQRPLAQTILTKSANLTTSQTYDATGNLTRTRLPDGSYLANAYDAAHRLIMTANPLGDTIVYTLDGLGDRTADAIGRSGTMTWQQADAFDAIGRAIIDVGGAGQTTTTAYDSNGNPIRITDPLSRISVRSFDALNRVTTLLDPAKGTTRISYDAHDRITGIVAPNGAGTTYAYDGLGRLITRVSPDTGTASFAYDLADNLVQSTDAAGVVTNHAYDALNRIASTTYPADASENVAYAYDQAGHGFPIGRLTSVADAVGTLSYSYDALGNRLGETRVSAGVTLSTAIGYDAASRIASIAYPSGTLATYVHNLGGEVTGINVKAPGASAAVPIVSNVGYKPFGPLVALKYGNGLAETRYYDASYRLTKLVTGDDVQGLQYGYNAADDVLAIVDNVNTANGQRFGYDTLDHLTSATGDYGSLAWKYDLVGNQLTQLVKGGPSTEFQYAANSNLLTGSVSGSAKTAVTTSAAGNILAIASTSGSASSFTYNQAERLARVTVSGSQVASYTYDAFGRRFSKELTAGQSLFQYGLARELLEETNGNGGLVTDTIYLNGAPIADVTPTAVYYLHTDRLGTPQVATTTQQAVAWRAAYLPFGVNKGANGLFTQDIRFPGQYSDNETGYYQNGFRDYYPLWGRYLESDPIGLHGGINPFVYAGDNPLVFTDKIGLFAPGPELSAIVGILIVGIDLFETQISYENRDATVGYALNELRKVENRPLNLCSKQFPYGSMDGPKVRYIEPLYMAEPPIETEAPELDKFEEELLESPRAPTFRY